MSAVLKLVKNAKTPKAVKTVKPAKAVAATLELLPPALLAERWLQRQDAVNAGPALAADAAGPEGA